MIKAIIFDFDGLIIDTETVWFETFKEVLKEYGIDLTLEQFAKVIGTHDAVLYSYIHKNSKKPVDSAVIKKAADELFYLKMGEPLLREGVLDYLNMAQALGLKIALASSSSRNWVVSFLDKLQILPYFEVIKTRENVANVKPDPELYLKALEELQLSASEAIAFEDSLNGLKAARAAGLQCVIVPNSVTSQLEFTDFSLRLNSMIEKALAEVIHELGLS